MANIILLWSDSVLRIKLSQLLFKLFENLPQRILGELTFKIIIINKGN